jgi:4-hydroxythreonine-4-phosphate dehydrogenase
MKPRVGLLLGDPCGIGPELIAKLLAQEDLHERAEILVMGDPPILQMGERIGGVSVPVQVVSDLKEADFTQGKPVVFALQTIDPTEVKMGEALAAAGRSVMEAFKLALQMAKSGGIDGICYGPLNKHAMHLAGCPYPGELQFFAHELGHKGPVCEMNVLGRLWTSRVTSHIPLSRVSKLVTINGVLQAVLLAHRTLLSAGYDTPRIAVAALNPHGGESGDCGTEEIEIIGPAVARAQAQGVAAEGPFPADTIFLKARDGLYDAVVTMYHDQGQIAMKLMGFDRGVSVQGGLEIPIATPSHGTAFDIAGQGRADVSATRQAFLLLCDMARTKAAAGTARAGKA